MIEKGDTNFIENFQSYIMGHNKDALKSILDNPKFKDEVFLNGMDLLSIICENVEEKMIDFKNSEDIYCKIINFISRFGNPKEIICILNLHLNKDINDFKFLILLFPLSIVLQRLDLSQPPTINILNDSLHCSLSHFRELPIAHYGGLEGKELEVYIQASETQRFLTLSKTYLLFLETLMKNEDFLTSPEVRACLLRNVLQLFDLSLMKLAFYCPGIVAEENRSCANRAFHLAGVLAGCLHDRLLSIATNNRILKHQIDKCCKDHPDLLTELELNLVQESSLVAIFYHIFVLQSFDRYPQIFLPIYNWTFCLPVISICLQNSIDPHVIRLCLTLLSNFDQSFVQSSIRWNREFHPTFFRALQTAATSNFNREIRGLAFDIFRSIFCKLVVKGRYRLLKILLKEVNHFGFKGQLILLLKREIIDEISIIKIDQLSDETHGRRNYFIGGSVYRLICDIFTLPDGDETDVVHESEWILAALNLLYVVFQRDSHHLVGLDVLIVDFQRQFLRPLARAAELSLAHYLNEKRLFESDDCGDGNSSIIDRLDSSLACMDKKQKIDFVNKAILTIELVRCNVGRLTSVI